MGGACLCARSTQVVQEIKVLRSSVSQREKERAERATLVQQERLVKAKVRCTSYHPKGMKPPMISWGQYAPNLRLA